MIKPGVVMNEDDLRGALAILKQGKSYAVLAGELGVQASKLCDYMNGRVFQCPPCVLEAMGVKRIVCYRAKYGNEK